MKKIVFMACVGMMTLASCDPEPPTVIVNNIPGDGTTQSEVTTKAQLKEINATIEGMTQSRVANDQWEAGDSIGVYFFEPTSGNTYIASNSPFIRQSGSSFKSTANIYFKNTKNHAIAAYYPYRKISPSNLTTGQMVFTTPTTATAEAQKKVDFMWASSSTLTQGSTPSLTFQHKMTRVKINIIAGDGWSGSQIGNKVAQELAQATYSLHADWDAICYASNGSVSSSLTPETKAITGTQISTTSSPHFMSFDFILPPQEFEKTKLNILTTNGFEYILDFESAGSYSAWAAGKIYTYNATINKSGLKVISNTITPWTTTTAVDTSLNSY